MILSDLSVKRPVFASVIALLLIVFGIISFAQLPLREYPDIDPPIVTIQTNYQGAAANVVETRITQIVEDSISGVEGIKYVASSSQDGRSTVTIEFDINRDIEAAANDVRDRVSRILDDLPNEADPPEVSKVDSSEDVILWLNLVSDRMSVIEITDYAKRYLEDRFSVLPGVARVRIGGGLDYSMRIWLDRTKLAARGLTANDIEEALRAENIELPAGAIESRTRQFTVRIERSFRTPDDFSRLVIGRGEGGYLVRLGDVARIEKAAVEDRVMFRGNGESMIGIGIIKQSTANTISVAEAAVAEAERLEPYLPAGMQIINSYDTSVFIKSAIFEVYKTLAIAVGLVILVIFAFLGSFRAMLIPAVTVPVSLIATFIMLNIFGFSINLLTLLALVLAIGLVVDDAIVVLENIYRRIENGQPSLLAAYEGTRQVGFAVIATTVVLVAVFVPITFLDGDLGRLFTEFALTMAAAVVFSTLIAVTLCAMMCAQILKREKKNPLSVRVDIFFDKVRTGYQNILYKMLGARLIVMIAFAAIIALMGFLYTQIPNEYAPREDRGAFFILVNGPEGASYEYTEEYMTEIEKRLMPYVESGEIMRLLIRAPRGFGVLSNFNDGMVIAVLNEWSQRRSAWVIMDEVRAAISDLPGVRAFPVMRQAFGGGITKPVQFVIGGGTFEELAQWREILNREIAKDNPGLQGIDYDYKETKPQLRINIDTNRAGDLGVSVRNVGTTLETMLGSRRVTTFLDDGEEYDVILEGERASQSTPTNIENLYVRSETTGLLIPLSNLVTIEEFADSGNLNRYNRIRAITLEANLDDNLTLGAALDYLEKKVQDHLPETAAIDYKGQSLKFKESGTSIIFVFIMGLVVVFLVLAAQFESYIHPFVIMLTVPLAIAGALLGMYLTGGSLNVYTQVGLIMLVGLASKNGILIVEFVNQLRDSGIEFREALVRAAGIRLRPIVMTGITTTAGSVPLLLAFGAGAETRTAIGVVILFGVLAATFFTLFIVPVAYDLLARGTGSPNDVAKRLEQQKQAFKDIV